jgi:hypothetical protein
VWRGWARWGTVMFGVAQHGPSLGKISTQRENFEETRCGMFWIGKDCYGVGKATTGLARPGEARALARHE